MATDAQIRAATKHNKTRDAITLRIPKADGAEIRAAAAQAGQSVTAFIMAAVRAYMAQDGRDG